MSKEDIAAKRIKFIQSLEGIGDILVFETRRQKNNLVSSGMKKISDTINKMFEMQNENLEKFEQLVFEPEFIEHYNKLEDKTLMWFTFKPEKHLVGFLTPIDQIIRVYEAAINSQNLEISILAVQYLNLILEDLALKENNNLFIEAMLGKLSEITKIAVKNDDGSAHFAATRWYTTIVFNEWRETNGILLSYLGIFDRFFFLSIRFIVSENQTSLFNSLISSITDGIQIPLYERGKVWEYRDIILDEDQDKYNRLDEEYDIERKVTELAFSEESIDSLDELQAWLEKFDQLKIIFKQHLSTNQKKEAKKIEEEITNVVTLQIKYNNLLGIVYATGAYCLFKKKYAYIKYLWEYKQPSDSDASWGGHEIIPNNLNEIVQSYFRRPLLENKYEFWEGHHGNRLYFKQYFLLLLARVLQSIPANETGDFTQIEEYHLPPLHIYPLSGLENSIDELVEMAIKLRGEKVLLSEVGLDANKVEELFDRQLVPFLRSLKTKARDQIAEKHKSGEISQSKVDEFFKEVKTNFEKTAGLRSIFVNFLHAYNDKTKENLPTQIVKRGGIDQVERKAPFFEEWHVNYVGMGGHYGARLASFETSVLLTNVVGASIEISTYEFDKVLLNIENPDDIFIVGTNYSFRRFLMGTNNFRSKRHKSAPQLELESLTGWYELNDRLIPVFEVFHRGYGGLILILNKATIGELVQYNPLNSDEGDNFRRGIFYMDIKAFSENPEMVDDFISKQLDWLEKQGDDQKKTDYLKTRVHIQMYERFEYIKPDDFEGYKIILPDDIPSK